MSPFPSVLISSCLLGFPTAYDGRGRLDIGTLRLQKGKILIPVCPECLGGLPTPRVPSEIQADGSVRDQEGKDCTKAFMKGAASVFRIALSDDVDSAILKDQSPSCGVHTIYDGSFTHTTIPGMGKTSAYLKKKGIKVSTS
ncbi:MAG: DUF523 domain-containing protein [Candidatus Izemoplasmatales bacterium]|nr:DUF523 domain-containing protein [Candidatus Izemoplasmatales bacterium]